jgi:hypothetical protein
MWLPILCLIAIVVRRREPLTDLVRWLLTLSIWAAIQATIIAYGRGAGAAPPPSRYMDFLSFVFVANAFMAISALDGLPGRRTPRRIVIGCVAVWLIFALVGLDRLTQDSLKWASVRRQWMDAYVENLSQFIQTDDVKMLAAKPFPEQLPYFDPIGLANAWLRHPYVRQTLPGAIRQPLRLQPELITKEAFARDGYYPTTPSDPRRQAWGSYTAEGNLAQGRFESGRIEPCTLGRLKFGVAGYLGERDLSLGLKSLSNGLESGARPHTLAKEQWSEAIADCPSGPFQVVATDANPERWFAFREPVEIGSISSLAESLIDRSRGLLVIAFAFAVIVMRLAARGAKSGGS